MGRLGAPAVRSRLWSLVVCALVAACGGSDDDPLTTRDAGRGDASPVEEGGAVEDGSASGDVDADDVDAGSDADTGGDTDAGCDGGTQGPFDLVTRATDDTLTQSLYNSYTPDLTPDGRYVVFASSEPDLVAPNLGSVAQQVFLRDRTTGTTRLVSRTLSGAAGNGRSERPRISDDGCNVVFVSAASDLVTNDTNQATDVFMADVCSEPYAISLVSVDESGNPLATPSAAADLSGDGRYVAFENQDDIWVYSVALDTSSPITQGNYASRSPSISRDGARIAFWSYASNLVAADQNGMWDIFVYDTQGPSIALVSATADGAQQTQGGEGVSTVTEPTISADGTMVAFRSRGAGLDDKAQDGLSQVYAKNLQDGSIQLVSRDDQGNPGDGDSSGSGSGLAPALSASGRVVAFTSEASFYRSDETDTSPRLAVVDLDSLEVFAFSPGVGDAMPALSGDPNARYLAFFSTQSLDERFDSSGIFVLDSEADPGSCASASSQL